MTQLNWSTLFKPSPRQIECLYALKDYRYILFGGARGGGKSFLLRWWLLQSLIEYYKIGLSNVRVMLACESYPVLQDRQVSKINIEFPRYLGEVKKTQTDGLGFYLKPEFGGGAILLRNLDEPAKYMGAEFAAIGIDQIEKVPVDTFNMIRGSLRWVGVRKPRMIGTANPGGMAWVKQYWIDHVFPKELEDRQHEFAFIQSLPSDNEYLDPSYWEDLNSQPERLRKAWVEGDWGVFSGQAFPAWDENRHTCEPFEIPDHWLKFRGIDWGTQKPFACLWVAKEPTTGRIYLYREIKRAKLTDRHQARIVRDLTPPQETIAATYADPSMWNTKNLADVVSSSDNEYMREGVYLTKADNSRLNGKRKVDRLLENLPDGKPGLIIFKTCKEFIKTFPYMMLNEEGKGDPEDVNCFVKGTLISTPHGDVPVENIVAGDIVQTPIGNRKIVRAGASGTSERVIDVTLSNGNVLKGTYNHGVFVVGKGLVDLDRLEIGDVLIDKKSSNIRTRWRLKRLSITASYIAKATRGIIIDQVERILNLASRSYTGRFILTIMEKFRMGLTYTTLTTTAITTRQKISSLCQVTTTPCTMAKWVSTPKSMWTGMRLKNSRRLGASVLSSVEKTHRKENLRADIVERLLSLSTPRKNFAINAKNAVGFSRNLALFAKKIFGNTVLHKPAHIVAVGNYESEMVYELTVEEAHLYYANGVLVSNSDQDDHEYDALRYALTSYRSDKSTNEMRRATNPAWSMSNL